MTGRVAIIGAGPCGLGALRAYQTASDAGVDVPEVVCYEKQDDWGGLWNYTWRTGTDEHGEPVHGSMYRYLWSNGPKECLEFADYSFVEHFGQPIPSFPPRAVLADYILGRATEAGVRKHIRFSTPVKHVSWDDNSQQFAVTARNHAEDRLETEMYDWVIVANGHFSVPNIPSFDGIESFSGRVMHGHDFRDAREFNGKNVLIVGGSYSAEDISLQCHKYGASSVTISYRSGAMGFSWPDTMKEVPLISSIDNSTVNFSDGTSGTFDAIIMCTGYLHSFPFLEDSLRLKTGNRLYPADLYKGVVWQSNPRLMYLGMQDQYYTFSMFDLQAWFARDVTLGRVDLGDEAAIAADIDAWHTREQGLEDPYQEIDFQADYCRDLAALVDYPEFDIDLTVKLFVDWEHDKEHNILTYRDSSFASAVDGTISPKHHTPWLGAMDDSLDTFLATEVDLTAADTSADA